MITYGGYIAKPKIADKKPIILEMEPDTYWWCSCGQSSKQPFCNGAMRVQNLILWK